VKAVPPVGSVARSVTVSVRKAVGAAIEDRPWVMSLLICWLRRHHGGRSLVHGSAALLGCVLVQHPFLTLYRSETRLRATQPACTR
jgi:hypothetical protein